jgi:hypothetical protein
MFQKVNKLSYKYAYAMHGDKKLSEKCLRVFASKDDDSGVYKVKITDDGEHKEKIANTPDKCFIDNSDITGKRIPKKLDNEWYINLAKERIKDYLGGN